MNKIINVSIIAVHDNIYRTENYTMLTFLGSREFPLRFEKYKSIPFPVVGHVELKPYMGLIGKIEGIYAGKSDIIYEREGQYKITLQIPEPPGSFYPIAHSSAQSLEPIIDVRPESDFQQINDNKTTLGLSWLF